MSSIFRFGFSVLFLLFFTLNSNAETSSQSPVNVAFYGTIQGNMACTLNCGNCCTGQTISLSPDISHAIGSSSVALDSFFSEAQSYWIRGYFYQSKGSCDTGSCTFFHITSVNSSETARYDSSSQILQLPKVLVADQEYSATLAGPHQITQANEIVGQSADCSQGQQCAEGFECLSYTGIAGNTLKSCEISCIQGQYCPEGKSCINIADGPQNVCQ